MVEAIICLLRIQWAIARRCEGKLNRRYCEMDTIEADKESEVKNKPEAEEANLSAKSDRNRYNHKNLKLLLLIGSMLLAGIAVWGVTRGIQQEILIPASAIASESGACYT